MRHCDDRARARDGRAWEEMLDALPPLRGRIVLDLGCGVGEQAAQLVARGARVMGVDMDEERLKGAWSRRLPGAEFLRGDLRARLDLGVAADGLWSSYASAYFPDLPAALAVWGTYLRPGGWIAITEIDDLFGHEPLDPRTKSAFEAYARNALDAGRYDFHMGRKIRGHLERSGFTVSKVLMLEDRELSFEGPAGPGVIEAWRRRLDRMNLLRDFCGPGFEQIREEFLGCLARTGHRSAAKVYGCVATR